MQLFDYLSVIFLKLNNYTRPLNTLVRSQSKVFIPGLGPSGYVCQYFSKRSIINGFPIFAFLKYLLFKSTIRCWTRGRPDTRQRSVVCSSQGLWKIDRIARFWIAWIDFLVSSVRRGHINADNQSWNLKVLSKWMWEFFRWASRTSAII